MHHLKIPIHLVTLHEGRYGSVCLAALRLCVRPKIRPEIKAIKPKSNRHKPNFFTHWRPALCPPCLRGENKIGHLLPLPVTKINLPRK